MNMEKTKQRQNVLGIIGVILMAVSLVVFIVLTAVYIVANSIALYDYDGSVNYLVIYMYYFVEFFPAVLIGNLFIVYNSYCFTFNGSHLVASTVLGFVSVMVYAVGFAVTAICSMGNEAYARGGALIQPDRLFTPFNLIVLISMLFVSFMCYVQIAFLLYFSKVRKRINYTQIMHRYQRFRYVSAAVYLLYIATFVCGLIF